jgi:hypothetical protein
LIADAAVLAEIERAEAKAREILKQCWDDVMAVAYAIHIRKWGRLTGEEVVQAIRSSRRCNATTFKRKA